MLDDECLFGSSSGSGLTGCDEESEEIFAETNESILMNGMSISLSVACCHILIMILLFIGQ